MPRALPRLTYCSNVHAAPDLRSQLDSLLDFTAPIERMAHERCRTFGLGGWWPMSLVTELSENRAARIELRTAMQAIDVPLWTLNVFPFGDFHGETVKTAVYSPDWGEEDRLLYTRRCAEVGAGLVAAGEVLPMSTLPLGYRENGATREELRVMARNLARAASMLAAVEAETGVCCVLALEPEPNCLLETVAQTADFLDQWLFEEGNWTTVPQEHLRRHLGVCVDLCHLAVLGEDPLEALADLRRRGIEVPKIQVSSCLEVRHKDGLPELLQFEEPRYLHQTMAENGLRSLDLDGVASQLAEFEVAGRVRTHYHVPLDWDREGPFGSTQKEVSRVLTALAAGPNPVPLLEVETYTWSVLGDTFGDQPLVERIQRELDWVARHWQVGD